ncbi:TRAP transporter small permease [Pelagibacterium lentulum]|uniref:TRAP transporter small permease protein n=1 Tax=Pelagibacterium lentulum TaxID=2029865 RepID=A0A916VXG7_9HYPH|nr:TRAP transporter small permease subunit [Pelagibacterium lentulum]GGA49752.1 C4-dicarboxylate ABC transporter permease [Pelagibacterium lentulum]
MKLRSISNWLQNRATDVAVAMLTVMFLSFILQIFFRYVMRNPLGWTQEITLTMWLWLVFWGAAFMLKDRDHISFDILYLAVSQKVRRIFALVSAVALVAGFVASLPATYDYVEFMSIRRSSSLRIRLDIVFSVYLIFAVAIIARYSLRAFSLVRGADPDADAGPEPKV